MSPDGLGSGPLSAHFVFVAETFEAIALIKEGLLTNPKAGRQGAICVHRSSRGKDPRGQLESTKIDLVDVPIGRIQNERAGSEESANHKRSLGADNLKG